MTIPFFAVLPAPTFLVMTMTLSLKVNAIVLRRFIVLYSRRRSE